MALKIERIELADIGQPVALARAVFAQTPKTFPVDVDAIALGAGIVEIKEHGSTSFEGALLTDEDKNEGFILVKRNGLPERRRFTIAHELGHLLNQWHKGTAEGFHCTTVDMRTSERGLDKSRQRMEMEANQFASELLMPIAEVSRRVGKSGVNIEDALRLATIFGVSKTAIIRRMTDVDPCAALIVSKEGHMEYPVPGKDFPWLDVKKGQLLPRGTITSTATREISDQVEVDCSTWLQDAQDPDSKLYEQVLVQDGGYRITLLVLDRSGCEDDDAERESRDRSEWAPTFRR